MITYGKCVDMQALQELFCDIRHDACRLPVFIFVAVRQIVFQISDPEFAMCRKPFRLRSGMHTAGKASGIIFRT